MESAFQFDNERGEAVNDFSQDDKRKLDDLHRALVGEPRYKREGLIAKVERHDRWINNAKIRIAGIVGGCTVIVWLLNKLF